MSVVIPLLLLLLIFARSIVAFLVALITGALYAVNGFAFSLPLCSLAFAFVFVPVAVGALLDRVCLGSMQARIGALVGAVSGMYLLLNSPLILDAVTMLGSERTMAEELALNAGIISVALECVVQVSVPLLLFLCMVEVPLVWLGRVRGMALGRFAASLRPLTVVLLLSAASRLLSEHILASFAVQRLTQ